MLTVLTTALAALLAAVTLLPLSGRHQWWIRMWDFPRVQIAILQVVVLVLAIWMEGPLRWAVVLVTAGGLLLHLARIRPFTPLARREMRFAPVRGDGHEVTLLAANVLLENKTPERIVRLIEEVDPDVLLLMETDERWLAALGPTLARYPTVLTAAHVKYYGMAFATRLETEGAELVELTRDGTPTCFADLRTPGGRLFHFAGLHPQPPVPGVDTEERDAQILYAARFARKTDVPLVVMGDFNDAAWSDTARSFKRYGEYLDPRRGRGLFASFHANNVLVRVAIDQLYVTEEVAICDFRLGPRVGSDHFPVIARVRIDPEEARGLNRAPPPLSAEEREEIERRLKDYADELRRRPEVDDAVGALPVAAEDAGSAPARAKAERGEVEP
jgi:endonuclease/exonuclease/phosphatase (EEP) superfamily protein YafD